MSPRAATSRAVTPRAVTRSPVSVRPSLRVERSCLRSGAVLVAGMDEVGRGALAGPVSVGIVVVGADTRSAPTGLRDSKLLTATQREALVPKIRRWALAYAVGHADNDDIDTYGIMAALRLAARRALAALPVVPDIVILDGSHDWLTPPERVGLLAYAGDPGPGGPPPSVRTLVKADRTCSSVSAASVLAKVERDAGIVALAPDYPVYGWAGNKGYAAPEHLAALAAHGPCALHRRSWALPAMVDNGAGGPAPLATTEA